MAKVYVPVVMDYWKGLFRTYTTTIVLKTLLESEAPEAHQVLNDLDLASKEVTYLHCIGGGQKLLL